ncbi:hypothetical protein TRFO_22770 [Tritrichomonas foetus]|uniref:Uncharacterized protein n=1 Tax=Tritrichomonas foetus TaxID=1144522 RepID=A0A1J4KCD2_9EUKA|nr:hypothetical protein TRFO_22770 [Tritrichomonas foetus]|eukprot:OHT08592.1 hypothetical protein TRFO_22770 [Tritrichomonas foetus]
MSEHGMPVYSVSTPQLNADDCDDSSEVQESILAPNDPNLNPLVQNPQRRFYKTERNSSVPNFEQCTVVPRSPSINVQIDINELADRDGEVVFSQDILRVDSSDYGSSCHGATDATSNASSNQNLDINSEENQLKPYKSLSADNSPVNSPSKNDGSPSKRMPKVPSVFKGGSSPNNKQSPSKPGETENNADVTKRRKSQIPTHLYETSLHRPPPKISTNYLNRRK